MKTLDDTLFSTKWEILQLIASSPKNATQLATTLKTSLANITQQTKLLEAYGTVLREKEETPKKVGKPRLRYRVAKDFSYIGLVTDGFAEKKSIILKDFSNAFVRSLLVMNQEEQYVFVKFLILHESILQKCPGIGLLKVTKDTIELFLHSEAVDEIRKKYSNTIISDLTGKNKKVICWTHTGFEIDEGIFRKDPYFMNMFKSMVVLQDRGGTLIKAKRQVES